MSNTNNNPISSVPEPSTAASSSSSNAAAADPLANIITQVSPTSAGASSRAGPARPTRVAKQQVERKKKKEKKDDGKTTAASAASAATPSAPVEEESANDGGPALLSTEEEEQSHSQKASSTLVGTSTSKGSHVIPHSDSEKVGLTQDKPLDAAATPTEPDPAVPATSGIVTKDEPSTAGKTKNVASVTEKKSAEKGGQVANGTRDAGARSDETSSRTVGEGVQQSRSEKTGAASAGATKRRKSKAGFMSRLLAILTCSAGSKAALQDEEEEMSEKRGTSAGARSGMKSSSGNGMKGAVAAGTSSRLSPRSAAKGSRAPSQRGSLDKTAGGGTRLPRDETGDVMSGAVVPPGSSFVVQDADGKKGLSGGGGGSGSSSMHKAGEDDEDGDADDDDGDGEDDEEWMGEEQMEDDEDQTEEQRLIMQGGAGIPRDDNGDLHPLLEPIHEQDSGRKCLVLDLDETLVHSSFKMISNADFTVPVEIEGTVHNVYVIKRPGIDEFMRKMGELYEVVVFTASLSKYADPVLDILDIHQVVRHRLFRESCYNHRGNYVKDLSQLGRDIETSIIIDNSPASYIFHPNNAVPISSWFNDPHDTELTDLCPFLAELADVQDVRAVLDGGL